MKTMKMIFLENKKKRELRNKYGVCYNTINYALRHSTTTYLAQCIREDAVKLGGVIINNSKADESADDNNKIIKTNDTEKEKA